MSKKAPPLWEGNTPKRELRMPNLSGNSAGGQEQQTAPPLTRSFASTVAGGPAPPPPKESPATVPQNVLQVKSTLSAEAPEFYPPGYLATQAAVAGANPASNHSVQGRLKVHRSSSLEGGPPGPYGHPDSDFLNSPDDVRLKHLITTLTKDPGQFADLVDIFMDTLSPYYQDIIALSRAAELLVGQAIDSPSFRYTAARLCCLIEQFCPEFRAALHLTCEKALQNNPNKSGLLLFVAELYSQLHHENIYGTYLIDAFKHLLVMGGNDNVKSICQSLKLTGHSLELYDKKALDEVFGRLLEIRPRTSGTALTLLDTVLELRRQQWGYSNSPTSASGTMDQEGLFWDNVPNNTQFLRVDGSNFTSEENQFLSENIYAPEEFGYMSDPDDLCDPEPEMDEEIQEAFKDFVKLSKR